MDFSISGIILIAAMALSTGAFIRDNAREKQRGRLISREGAVIYCLTGIALVYWVVRYIVTY